MDTKELVQKAKQAKSPEDLVELSKGTDDELTLEQAQELFAKLQASGELSDDELDDVAGGCGGSGGNPTPEVVSDGPKCPVDGGTLVVYMSVPWKGYDKFICTQCHRGYRHYFDGDRWTEEC